MARNQEHDGIKNPYVRFQPLKKPKLEKQLTTLWDFPSQHYGKSQQGSAGYKGATPSYVIWNVIQRYTEAGARILDPFCGSGTTLDVCKDMGRVGMGYDLAPYRKDIEACDARSLPLKDKDVHLIFMDPPYGENIKYSDNPECIGKKSAQKGAWQKEMSLVFEEAHRVLKNGGYLAVYVQDIWVQKDKEFAALGYEVMRMGSHFFKLEDHVVVVRRNKDLERGNYRKAADENNFMLRGFNHLLIFKKSRKSSPVPAQATSDSNPSSRTTTSRTGKKPAQRSTSRTERNDRRRTKKSSKRQKI
jgi:adenine-specific DNA-methyltransferase